MCPVYLEDVAEVKPGKDGGNVVQPAPTQNRFKLQLKINRQHSLHLHNLCQVFQLRYMQHWKTSTTLHK